MSTLDHPSPARTVTQWDQRLKPPSTGADHPIDERAFTKLGASAIRAGSDDGRVRNPDRCDCADRRGCRCRSRQQHLEAVSQHSRQGLGLPPGTAVEARLTELLIGELLGPAENHGPATVTSWNGCRSHRGSPFPVARRQRASRRGTAWARSHQTQDAPRRHQAKPRRPAAQNSLRKA
jgi:hypothetical protein